VKVPSLQGISDLSSRSGEPADPVSERIIDAAVELMARYGTRIKIEEIAEAAQVSRATVFRRFEDKASIIERAFGREFRRILESLRTTVEAAEDPLSAVVGMVAESLRLSQAHPLILRMCQVEPQSVIELVGAPTEDSPTTLGRAFLAGYIKAAQEEGLARNNVQAEEVADVLAHLLIGYSLVPYGTVNLTDRHELHRFSKSLVVSLLGSADSGPAG
jgi:TetR/AcrR family transcriptional repressor of uid operon